MLSSKGIIYKISRQLFVKTIVKHVTADRKPEIQKEQKQLNTLNYFVVELKGEEELALRKHQKINDLNISIN